MSKYSLSVTLALVASLTHPALAEDGYYVGFNSIRTEFIASDTAIDAAFEANSPLSAPVMSTDTTGKGYEILAGQYIARDLSIEASLFNLGEIVLRGLSDEDNGSYLANIGVSGVSLSFHAYMPFQDAFSLFAFAGWQYTKTRVEYDYEGDGSSLNLTTNAAETGVFGGLGLQIRIGSHAAIRLVSREHYDAVGPYGWTANSTALGFKYLY